MVKVCKNEKKEPALYVDKAASEIKPIAIRIFSNKMVLTIGISEKNSNAKTVYKLRTLKNTILMLGRIVLHLKLLIA